MAKHVLILRSRRSRRLEGWAAASLDRSSCYRNSGAVAHPSRRSLRSLLRVRSVRENLDINTICDRPVRWRRPSREIESNADIRARTACGRSGLAGRSFNAGNLRADYMRPLALEVSKQQSVVGR